jgi:signal transduction histidine kinase
MHFAEFQMEIWIKRSRDELGELTTSFNKMNSELVHSLNLRKQMTADIAHERRTPSSINLGHAEAVHDGVLLPTEENFEIIRDEATRLNGLADDLGTISLADVGELRLDMELTAVHELLEEERTSYLQSAHKKNITLEVRVQEYLPKINIDPRRLLQVLNNLLNNALLYTPISGKVILSGEHWKDCVESRVKVTESELQRKSYLIYLIFFIEPTHPGKETKMDPGWDW